VSAKTAPREQYVLLKDSLMKITTRLASQQDYQWLYDLKIASMRTYVEAVYGWDDAVQKDFFDKDFCPEVINIVTVDGLDAGMFELERNDNWIFLKRIEIHPLFQTRGIGSTIIQRIIAEAVANGKSFWLMVFKINPAKKLYERLGFTITEETETHYKMLWQNHFLQPTRFPRG
jgi:ribosomal protein S18 acetylase RimI-like enzyme